MIIFCEPQCVGFEHVEVNAALLAAARFGLPDQNFVFAAEASHLALARKKLEQHAVDKVSYRSIHVPDSGTINLFRFRPELNLVDQLLSLARQTQSRHVVFTSVTSATLISIKLLIDKYPGITCTVIPHGILESVAKGPAVTPWHFVFWFKFALTFKNTPRLRYLLLGQPIQSRLAELVPSIKERLSSIDHPTFYQDLSGAGRRSFSAIRFGIFGVAHRAKGFDLFFRLAEEVTEAKTAVPASFLLVGHVGDAKLKGVHSGAVDIPSPDVPLSRDKFDAYAKEMDYAVYFYPLSSYQLTASGALFDAFSYGKPIIALRNRFFQYYFDRFGDIGYLCDSYEEVKSVVMSLLAGEDAERYRSQVLNLLRGREELGLERIGAQLKTVLEQ